MLGVPAYIFVAAIFLIAYLSIVAVYVPSSWLIYLGAWMPLWAVYLAGGFVLGCGSGVATRFILRIDPRG